MITKQDMLLTGIVLDNVYLDYYVELINQNKTTKKQKGVTHAHHVIPKYYFTSKNLPINNSSNNIVNLKYSDHILSHYYLSECSTTSYFAFSNISAIKHLVGNNMDKLESYNIIESLIDLQDLYEKYSLTRENNIDLTGVNKGKIWVTNDHDSHRIYPEELNSYIEKGYRLGSGCSTNKGRIFVHKDDEAKMIFPEELDTYLRNEYKVGRPQFSEEWTTNISNSLKGRVGTTTGCIGINDGKHTKFVLPEFVDKYLSDGWVIGILNAHEGPSWTEEEREKISDRFSNSVWVHKGKQNYRVDKNYLNTIIEQGYSLGRYEEDKTKFVNKPFKWMTKDNKSVRVLVEDIDQYIAEGYTLGRYMNWRRNGAKSR